MALAYYNENDPYPAQWLRNLIDAKLIAHGVVDDRSIVDVRPDDLRGFNQCHFFAGIGGWSHAARLAGWPDDRPLWTGSCPCQPFSVAGKQEGQADKRHLWPELFRLTEALRPDVLMGEQVAAAVGKSWLDGVCADLESIGYATGAAIVPACAVDAPHRRDRLWFVADNAAQGQGRRGIFGPCESESETDKRTSNQSAGSLRGNVADRQSAKCERIGSESNGLQSGLADDGNVADRHQPIAGNGYAQRSGQLGGIERDTQSRTMGDGDGEGLERRGALPERGHERIARPAGMAVNVVDDSCERRGKGRAEYEIRSGRAAASESGFWNDSILVAGADGKARRVKPGVRLLVNGVSGRVAVRRADEQGVAQEHFYNRIGALRAFGNAIVPQVAASVIRACMDCRP